MNVQRTVQQDIFFVEDVLHKNADVTPYSRILAVSILKINSKSKERLKGTAYMVTGGFPSDRTCEPIGASLTKDPLETGAVPHVNSASIELLCGRNSEAV